MLACVMDVLLLCVRTLPKNPYWTSLPFILQMIWCNTNLSLHEPQNLFLANHFVALSTQSLVSVSTLSLKSCLFCLQSFQVSRCLSVLISCCCSTRPKSHVNLYLVITLVNTRRIWKLARVPCSVVFGN